MSDAPSLPIIDFHSHHVPSEWELTTTVGVPDHVRERWARINSRIADPHALVAAIEDGDLAARVVNIPTALFSKPGEELPSDLFRRVNDRLAEIVSRQPDSLYGLASVDAFAGETAAQEVKRAVLDLGLRGVFVESAKGDLLLDAPEARPALAAASALGVPVFVHPINPQPLTRQMGRYRELGTVFARGTINAASLVALIDGGVFKELTDLRVVVTNLAIGGLLLASGFGYEGERRAEADALLRRHVYIDTMGFKPSLVRAAIDILGVDNVIVGSDWPIVGDGPIGHRVASALATIGLSEREQEQVASGNTLRLLGVTP
jgi:predicted TIM-barrel fold metal-dependent hydrolase